MAESAPPPGRMVDVGGHRLHVRLFGSAGPVVTIEAAGPTAAFEWRHVIAELEPTCRIQTFERAGYGWSESGPKPRTSLQTARELRGLVEAGAIKAPFVLVAHSLGGVDARVYTATYPGDVSGLVLVDSSHEDQLEELPGGQRDLRRQQRVAKLAGVLARTGILRVLVRLGISPYSKTLRGLAPDDRRAAVAQACAPRSFETLYDEMCAVPESLAQGRSLRRSFGDLPLAVISRGRKTRNEEVDAAWGRLQAELATRSTHGRPT